MLLLCSATVILALAAWSYLSEGILWALLNMDMSASERVVAVQAYFDQWGNLAPLAYVLVVTVEVVVAPIPGIMLYAPGGLIFGGFWGGLLSLIGNVLGAGLAAGFMKTFRGPGMARWVEGKHLEPIVERLRASGIWVILALRINPLTTSDLVSYAAGLAGIPIWKVMLGTLLGMAPLCWAQAYLAVELFEAAPWLIYPLIILSLVYVIVAVFVIRKALTNSKSEAN